MFFMFFSARRRFSKADYTYTTHQDLLRLTGRVNVATFSVVIKGKKHTFVPGDCLFMGFNCRESNLPGFIDVTYRFHANAKVYEDGDFGILGDMTDVHETTQEGA